MLREKKEEGRYIYLIFDKKLTPLKKEEFSKRIKGLVDLTGNELISVLDNVIRIVKPDPNEKRFLGFKEEDINKVLEDVLKVDKNFKYKLFEEVVNDLDFKNWSFDELKKFLEGGYKTILISKISEKLEEKAASNINFVASKAISYYILRENFKRANLKVAKLLKENFTQQDYQIFNAFVGLKLKTFIGATELKNLLDDSFDIFYKGKFMNNLKTLIRPSDILHYHEKLFLEYKRVLAQNLRVFFSNKGINIDTALLYGLVSAILKKEEIKSFFKKLAYKILLDLKGNNYAVLFKYLKIIFSSEIWIEDGHKYKLPDFYLSNKYKGDVCKVLPSLREFLNSFEKIEKELKVLEATYTDNIKKIASLQKSLQSINKKGKVPSNISYKSKKAIILQKSKELHYDRQKKVEELISETKKENLEKENLEISEKIKNLKKEREDSLKELFKLRDSLAELLMKKKTQIEFN